MTHTSPSIYRALGALLTALLVVAGCKPVEGERCNPLLFSDECPQGLSCTYPANCGVAYCCPQQAASGISGNCQACPSVDGGMEAGTDGGPDGGTDGGVHD